MEDFGCWEDRQRLLSAAMAIRLVVAMALGPEADIPEVIRRAAACWSTCRGRGRGTCRAPRR